MINIKSAIRFAGFIGACTLSVQLAIAQTDQARYPSKVVRMVVGFSAGGAADVPARVIAQGLSETFGQQVIVDNRPGQDGILASNIVAKSPPDGYTLTYVTAGFAMNSILHAKSIPYRVLQDFAPISLVASGPLTLVVNPALPVRDVKGLVELAKKRPGQLNYASAGSGGTMHLAGELLKTLAKINIVHIPYKGGGPAVTDVIGGQVEFAFPGAPATMPFIRSGRLRILAVTTAKRASALPEVPTIAEMGYPDYEVDAWYGVLAPAGTPPAIVKRVSTDLAKTIAVPKVRESLMTLGIEPIGNSPEDFGTHLQKEITRWTPIVHKAGLKVD